MKVRLRRRRRRFRTECDGRDAGRTSVGVFPPRVGPRGRHRRAIPVRDRAAASSAGSGSVASFGVTIGSGAQTGFGADAGCGCRCPRGGARPARSPCGGSARAVRRCVGSNWSDVAPWIRDRLGSCGAAVDVDRLVATESRPVCARPALGALILPGGAGVRALRPLRRSSARGFRGVVVAQRCGGVSGSDATVWEVGTPLESPQANPLMGLRRRCPEVLLERAQGCLQLGGIGVELHQEGAELLGWQRRRWCRGTAGPAASAPRRWRPRPAPGQAPCFRTGRSRRAAATRCTG